MAFVKVERLDGFSHESNDCTVRALASACGLSYADAHLIAKEMGREVGKGFWMEKLFTSQKLSGFKFDRRKFINLNRRPMIVDVMKQQGTYIVRLVDRH